MGNLLTMLRPALFLASSPPPGAASSAPPVAASSPTTHEGVELAGVERRAARRRRQRLNRRQRKRTDIGASSSCTHEINAATPDTDSDAENGDSSGTPGLYAAKNAASAEAASSTGAADPKIAERASTDANALTSDAKKHEFCLDASKTDASAEAASSTGAAALTSDAKKHQLCIDPSKTDASAEAASSTGADDPKIAEPASTDPRALHLRTPPMGIGFPIDASPVADHDGLHGAALAVAATSTDQGWTTVPEKKRRAPPAPPTPQPHLRAAPAARFPDIAPRAPVAAAMGQQRPPAARFPDIAPRAPAAAAVGQQRPPAARFLDIAPLPPAAAAVGQQRAPATAGVGLLDDLHEVESFFGKLFEEEADEDQRREQMHREYVAACSALNKTYIYCLACFISEDKRKPTRIENNILKVNKHMKSDHKGASFPCAKRGCLAMATNRKDIGLHELYAHEM